MTALIYADGRYNRAEIFNYAGALEKRMRERYPEEPADFAHALALHDAWTLARSQRTGYDVAHGRNLTEVPAWAARDLATDGRIA